MYVSVKLTSQLACLSVLGYLATILHFKCSLASKRKSKPVILISTCDMELCSFTRNVLFKKGNCFDYEKKAFAIKRKK